MMMNKGYAIPSSLEGSPGFGGSYDEGVSHPISEAVGYPAHSFTREGVAIRLRRIGPTRGLQTPSITYALNWLAGNLPVSSLWEIREAMFSLKRVDVEIVERLDDGTFRKVPMIETDSIPSNWSDLLDAQCEEEDRALVTLNDAIDRLHHTVQSDASTVVIPENLEEGIPRLFHLIKMGAKRHSLELKGDGIPIVPTAIPFQAYWSLEEKVVKDEYSRIPVGNMPFTKALCLVEAFISGLVKVPKPTRLASTTPGMEGFRVIATSAVLAYQEAKYGVPFSETRKVLRNVDSERSAVAAAFVTVFALPIENVLMSAIEKILKADCRAATQTEKGIATMDSLSRKLFSPANGISRVFWKKTKTTQIKESPNPKKKGKTIKEEVKVEIFHPPKIDVRLCTDEEKTLCIQWNRAANDVRPFLKGSDHILNSASELLAQVNTAVNGLYTICTEVNSSLAERQRRIREIAVREHKVQGEKITLQEWKAATEAVLSDETATRRSHEIVMALTQGNQITLDAITKKIQEKLGVSENELLPEDIESSGEEQPSSETSS
jgi:hypothetical protein